MNKGFYKKFNILAFLVIIFMFFLLNLVFNDNSTVSLREKRKLTQKPSFSKQGYISGSFFKEFEQYFCDNFFCRENFIDISNGFAHLRGYSSDGVEIINTNKSMIDIGEKDNENKSTDKSNDKNIYENSISDSTNDVRVFDNNNVNSDSKSTKEIADNILIKKKNKDTNDEIDEEDNKELNQYGQFIIVNNTGYELFSYNEYFMSFYFNAINYYADNVDESVKIYSLIAPTSSEFNLPEKYKELSDAQLSGIEYINGKLRDRVERVDIYTNLQNHSDEYLYFNTDHHWTALGAYRAYEAFLNYKGEKPITLDNYKEVKCKDKYLGSIFNMTASKKLTKNKDDIWYYNIDESITYEVFDKEKNSTILNSVFYTGYFNKENKYALFMGGDFPFAKITTQHDDKGKILIIKDSYANAFIPFLIPHYSEIYVADPRSCPFNVIDVINDNCINELAFVDYAMALKLPGFSDMIKGLATIEDKIDENVDENVDENANENVDEDENENTDENE
ncbi:hypothetical protein JYG23_02675 [Sedimentibacter sp. zth1]|uniref:DHHW family protein n=1 Tax=Sedimentibacter sp. zth1 TaxID=2816908 RepID=UPI001A917E6D|nr:DHHW family protein [Sedimentibacter sp. zth1]QSX06383.1 hypothetical protein JYG23_02675 [Sedimentibacter sp. zth1]